MKTLKPFHLSCLTRVFEANGRPRLTLTALVGFDLNGKLVPEVDVWKLVGEELGDSAILDEALPKPVGEVLVHGKAFAPAGAPCTAREVRLELGVLKKRLYVSGDRHWRGGSASAPSPFTELPMGWERAFGGHGYPDNPLGRGVAPGQGPAGPVHWLPNIEDPKAAVGAPSDRPAPAGLGPYPATWPQRQAFVGTHGAEWLERRYPGLPDDFDARHWSTAPADQRLERGFHRGDEAFALAGLHPSREVVEGRLPEVRARLFTAPSREPGAALSEVETRLDTVWLFPHRERGVLVFRGVVEVSEADASDVALLLGAVERMSEPRPPEHYVAVRDKRLDKDDGALEILNELDLAPVPISIGEMGGAEGVAMAALTELPRHRERRMAQRVELEKARAREQLAGARENVREPDRIPVDPFPPVEPRQAFTLDDLPARVKQLQAEADQQKKDAEAQRDEAMAKARALCEEHGVDFESKLAEAEAASCGPPKFRAADELERMAQQLELLRNAGRDTSALEAQLSDPRLLKGLADAEAQLREAYRMMAHHQKPAPRLTGDAAAIARASVEAAIAARESLALKDLTGADISGLDLSGLDLRGAHLERASLVGTRLTGADLTSAVLARADLSAASLGGAKLAGANLGEANLTGADLTGADLTGAILAKANLSDAKLDGATLLEVDLGGATFKGASLRGAKLAGVNLIKVDLTGLVADGADLSRANLIECELEGVGLAGARLEKAVLVGCKAARLDLKKAELRGLIVVQDTSLAGSDLSGANLREANLRFTNLAGCDLSNADLDQADLSGADLTDAKLYRVTGRDARFVRSNLTRADLTSANLLGAILQDAIVPGAVFKGANLFRADLFRAKGDDQTSFAHALVTQARFQGAAGGLGAPAGAGKS
ncbi:MAG: DUF2169 domain-containing protein [Polyangiaceae bacterium]|jgi:uncharacterized protein YjbI with pentapeptide repeats|nr:DUF2169 domain-containing protein [Polyangiaceae bacterium]MBK8936210.1 DUF2169 domain-containing protein [Polyangiaceae bacterium]